MDQFEIAGCIGKERHDNLTVRKIARRYPEAEPYRCKICGHWHLGRRKKLKRKMRTAR